MASSVRERYGDRVHILATKRNTGHLTYDGIEVGGERVAQEVEETLDTLAGEGHKIRKLSIVGYSLGGLVARYAIGILDARGWLEKVEPVNFTTFATPHVGVRVPATGLKDELWNSLGSRSLSASGRQLFLIDSFRGTGRPLLSVLADPDSIFTRALAKFENRSAYANIVNDRVAVFYTTFISAVDPFKDLERLNISYLKGYEPVIIDPDIPPKAYEDTAPFATRVWKQITRISTKLPLWVSVAFILTLLLTFILINTVIQTLRSRQRIRLHEEGPRFENYKVPLTLRHAMEDAFEDATSRQDPEYVPNQETRKTPALGEKSAARTDMPERVQPDNCGDGDEDAGNKERTRTRARTRSRTLALTSPQLAIIDSLNSLGFRKYPVHIHNHRRSHAAIIVRMAKSEFNEGKIVIRHWLDGFRV